MLRLIASVIVLIGIIIVSKSYVIAGTLTMILGVLVFPTNERKHEEETENASESDEYGRH